MYKVHENTCTVPSKKRFQYRSIQYRSVYTKSHRNKTATARTILRKRRLPFRFVSFRSSIDNRYSRLGAVSCGCTDASKTAMALSASSCTVATICHSPPTFRACDRSPKSVFASTSLQLLSAAMERHETARNETKRNGFKTERHDCQKRQRNRMVNTVLQNDTEPFWKRFFDAYCTCV